MKGNASTNGDSSHPSTGLGSDVETIHSLLLAIKNLVTNSGPMSTDKKSALPNDKNHHVDDMNLFDNYSKGTFKEEESQDLIDEKLRLDEMEGFATDISMRAASLKSSVLGLLRKAVEGKNDVGRLSSALPGVKLVKGIEVFPGLPVFAHILVDEADFQPGVHPLAVIAQLLEAL